MFKQANADGVPVTELLRNEIGNSGKLDELLNMAVNELDSINAAYEEQLKLFAMVTADADNSVLNLYLKRRTGDDRAILVDEQRFDAMIHVLKKCAFIFNHYSHAHEVKGDMAKAEINLSYENLCLEALGNYVFVKQ